MYTKFYERQNDQKGRYTQENFFKKYIKVKNKGRGPENVVNGKFL